MKALTSSCSKAIANNFLEKSSGSINVSDHIHGFCLSLRPSRNHKVGNFQFLQLGSVENKAIHPIHAIESETLQEDLEIFDLETQSQETKNDSKLVRVRFQLQRKCIFGQQFFIVGDDPLVGSWNPSKGIPMAWSDGHIWYAELDIPVGKTIQFKFVLKKQGGKFVWQPGSDRIIQTWETMNRITVYEDWEKAEMQKIMEDEEFYHSNDDNMETLDEDLDHPTKTLASGDTKTHLEEKPLAESDLQQMLGDSVDTSSKKKLRVANVAEKKNIGSSEDNGKKMSTRRKLKKKTTRRGEESSYNSRNDAIMQDLIESGIVEPGWNQEAKVVDGNIFEFDEDAPNSDRVE